MPRDLDSSESESPLPEDVPSSNVEHARGLPASHPTLSPWQDRPSPYSKHISSTRLPDHADVCIIGTGLSGISTAWHLLTTDPTIQITLLEARTLCSAASGRNGGHLTSDLYNFAPGLLSAGMTRHQVAAHGQFEMDNFVALSRLIEEESIPCEYVRKKHYDVCRTEEEAQVHLDAIRCMEDCGGPLETVKVIYNPLASQLSGTDCHAIVQHDYSASINPYALTAGILKLMMDRFPSRIELYTQTPVLHVDGNTVCTSRGKMTCRDLVFAMNGYTASLLPSLKDVIVPVRGQVISRKLMSKVENCSFNLGGEYLSQRPTEVGVSDDASLSVEVSRYLCDFATNLESHKVARKIETREWTGIMGFAKLGIPVVTRLPRGIIESTNECQQYVLAGFTGHGMPRIFLSAKHIASLISGDRGTSRIANVPVPEGYEVIRTMTRADLSDR
ncbi:Predicted protein [Taphrina deformans PYCC 5710]|uniref:FAD dependent oxidoreductase domain-containing protein n=1 Tax=Taphrina deformans (strain PYCC 5710 / ATCC 11124 / CBS 356.35 / IMI 108563 / JCM 9778 / NBRC 8474) TaxID=1097556 RepID=R4X8J7_TAPDE|nr:Predicted protein [Taphrina deformans PYCC 5710]|eukprot:CCG81933.1 Predicted protein [Taphrina deformans PYCC 5710]